MPHQNTLAKLLIGVLFATYTQLTLSAKTSVSSYCGIPDIVLAHLDSCAWTTNLKERSHHMRV